MVAFRMDSRLRGRIDAADVVQEAFVQASAHRENFFRTPETFLYLWLRKIVCNKLFELHRHHLGAHMRDANRDRPLAAPKNWDDTAEALWLHLSGHLTSPSAAAVKGEIRARLAEALDRIAAPALVMRVSLHARGRVNPLQKTSPPVSRSPRSAFHL